MPTLSLLIALAFFSSPAHGRAPGRLSADRISHVAGWTVHDRYDFFTGQRGCQLFRPRIGYARGALIFHLGRRVDTSAAAYRIDDGVLLLARDDQADLVRLGFLLHDDNLDNPSGGLVRIPEARLARAGAIRIAAGAQARLVTFDLTGFAQARAFAASAGCTAETFGDSR